MNDAEPLLSVAALHALVYCERLFYFEEVERIRVADASVFAGRRMHAELVAAADEPDASVDTVALESERLGIIGRIDVIRRRDGAIIPYEHKRGRAAGRRGAPEAWETDRVQLGAYALLAEEAFGQRIEEGRVRYHASNRTVRVRIDEALRARVAKAVERARELRHSIERPPITKDERRCERCSLAPVCLPEEARLAADAEFRPIRLLPAHADRQSVHVTDSKSRITRRGEELGIVPAEGEPTFLPVAEVGTVVIHGFAQISTQALRLCADHDVGVHWMTLAGGLVGSLAPGAQSAQRHLRQFAALVQEEGRLPLARRLVQAKVASQLRYVLRATRATERSAPIERALQQLRTRLRECTGARGSSELLGIEGSAAREYFGVLPMLLDGEIDPRLRLDGRNRRPPKDRFNALLSFGYGMLYRRAVAAVVAVGLHPGVGVYHRPRSSALPLALDIMELFRVPIVDMAVVSALNRKTFDADRDFRELGGGIVLSDEGRTRIIEVIERRFTDEWKHDVVGYSMAYSRMIELEVRLLEKEWLGEGGLFARFRIR